MENILTDDMLGMFGGTSTNSLNEIVNSDDLEEDFSVLYKSSDYYDLETIGNFCERNKSNFTVFSLNVQSINAKIDKLKCVLELLQEKYKFLFSAICIQESWLGSKDSNKMVQIPNYTLFSNPKSIGKKSGLLVYLQNDFKGINDNIFKPAHSKLWEAQSILVSGGGLKQKIRINNVYRPPRLNNSNFSIETFVKEIEPYIDKFSKEPFDQMFVGDFNIDLKQIKSREKIQDYFDKFVSAGFLPKITMPTRFSKKNCTIIDQMFCNYKDPTIENESGILVTEISDHLPCMISFKIPSKHIKKTKYVKIIDKSDKNTDVFLKELADGMQKIEFQSNSFHDPNENYHTLEQYITKTLKKCFPEKNIRFNKYKHKLSPWMTSGILKSLHRRDKMYKKLKKQDCSTSSYLTLKNQLSELNANLQRLIRQSKRDFYQTEFLKFSGNCKKTWNTISDILNKKQKNTTFPSHFNQEVFYEEKTNGTKTKKHIAIKISDKQTISDQFNVFFSTIGSNLSNDIKYQGTMKVSDFLKNKINSKFCLSTVTDDDILTIIQKMKVKNSSGHDNISSRLLKQMAPIIHSALCLIINQSINTGIFPNSLKLAIVKPLFKHKDSEHSFGNYRPISLLTTISKVFERVIFNQLYEYMTINNLFINSQYGFRKKHSTELAALEFVDRIAKDMDKNKVPLSIFIDLSKAFDTLDHKILLEKLKYYGVEGTALSWFESYLSNRKQKVNYDGTLSITLDLKTGVPQGSILGPLLFIIYINDIVVSSIVFTDILFADDTSLISNLCNFYIGIPQTNSDFKAVNEAINTELQKLTEWLQINKLSLNVGKTKYMLFQKQKSKRMYDWLELEINGTKISRVDTFNFLGLTLNSNLDWKDHINTIANKISSTVGVLNKLKNFIPSSALKLIYSSLILPRLYYCNLIWGYKPTRLIKLQKRAVRILSKAKYNAHTDTLFKRHKLLTMEDIHISKKLCFFYHFQNNNLPSYFWIYMFRANSKSRTRNQDPIQSLIAKTTTFSSTIRFSLPILLKNTSPLIKAKAATHSYEGFKKYVKKFLLDRYQDTCKKAECYVCRKRQPN